LVLKPPLKVIKFPFSFNPRLKYYAWYLIACDTNMLAANNSPPVKDCPNANYNVMGKEKYHALAAQKEVSINVSGF